MNLYEHTIIARQDMGSKQLEQITEKYTKIIEKNNGKIVKTENWGLLNLSYLIKKNKKGNYLHFKIEGKAYTGPGYICNSSFLNGLKCPDESIIKTIEHLEILTLLGVKSGWVAITKIDIVTMFRRPLLEKLAGFRRHAH